MPQTVFITGATSGIGKACAEKFAEEGYRVLICGRRKERLRLIQGDLERKFHTEVFLLSFDIRDQTEVRQAIGSLPEAWKNPDILINNAGLALGFASLQEGDTRDWDTMIDTNIKGLLYVSRAILPGMVSRRSGQVFNIGSTAAKGVYPNGNVYCASKQAVEALSKAMRIDLLPFAIKVTAIHPGAAETEFALVRFKGDIQRAGEVYRGYIPLKAQDIAGIIFYCATLPPHVCINDLVVSPLQQADAHYFHKS